MHQAILIYNPKSGRQVARRLLPEVRRILVAGGFEVEPVATGGPGDATRLAREAAADRAIEVAFAMGGDGTLREVACGLLGSEIALAPLPTGTTNVMALALGLPREAAAAARVYRSCVRQQIDVGLAGGEPFLMQVSGGLDAAVMARQNSRAKKRFGKGAVGWTGLEQWLTYEYPEIDLLAGGQAERVSLFAACNIPFYAGAFRMAPDADLRDGQLDLVLFRGRGRFATLGFAADLVLGRHSKRPDVEVLRVERLEVTGPPEILVQLDGDAIPCALPLEIRLAADRLWVLAPEV